jgi:hypothetical protein
MLFAYLSDSDSLNVTSVYELYPWRHTSVLDAYREEAERLEHRRT